LHMLAPWDLATSSHDRARSATFLFYLLG
jgi:hypothetical protein